MQFEIDNSGGRTFVLNSEETDLVGRALQMNALDPELFVAYPEAASAEYSLGQALIDRAERQEGCVITPDYLQLVWGALKVAASQEFDGRTRQDAEGMLTEMSLKGLVTFDINQYE